MSAAFERVFEDYLAFLERAQGLSPSALYLHRRHGRDFVRDVRRQGLLRWHDLTPRHVDRHVRRCVSKFHRPYRANVLGVIRRFLKYLHFRGLVDRPLHELLLNIRLFRFERLPRFLTREELARLLGAVDRRTPAGRRDYAAILLLISTGLRAGELVRLTLDDVDWRARLLRVEATKTRSSRAVPIPGPAFSSLVEYIRCDRSPRASCRSLFIAYGPGGRILDDPEPSSYNILERSVRHALRKAGIDPRNSSCHRFRHTYAQHLLEQGIGYPALQALLGHGSLHTVGFYARVHFSQLREVADNYAEEM